MSLPPGPRIPRRRALVVIGMGVVAVGVTPLALAGCGPPPVPVDVTVDLDPATLPVDEPTVVTFDVPQPDGSIRQGSAWFVRKPDDSLVVYDPRCTHQRCVYAWADVDEKFVCACHEAAFDIEGAVLYGPPPAPLTRLPVTVTGSMLMFTVQSDVPELKPGA
jgi:cytochrome b6-f complex iron-sulfur subunit